MNDEYAVGTATEGGLPYMQMGTSFIVGLAVGYFLKKSFKLLLLILGLGLVILFVLESQGAFQVDDTMIKDGVQTSMNSFQNLYEMLKTRLGSMELSSGVGAVAGFLAGLKFG
ncbi:hypothetical protein MNB_SV-12-804 [hydrothermal vent metagenome]|uniref:FUN14 family protein n=1 Tax=hydrothermal vent metagenome TaxID=652676 RepID=A0A1W1BX52_9ZZZZ